MSGKNDRLHALARSRHLCPGYHTMPKPGEMSKQEMQDMLREAAANTAKATSDDQ